MKFTANFSETGVGWLERRFLPAFEKASPHELSLLLTPTHIYLARPCPGVMPAEL